MSLLFFDGGGEYYNTAHHFQVWDRSTNTVVNGSGGRRGGAALEFNQSQNSDKSFPETDTIFCGFAAKIPNFASRNELIFLRHREITHVTIRTDLGGRIRVERATGAGVFLADSPMGVLKADTWHFIEIKAVIHDSTGAVIVRVDGTEVINISGVDTRNSDDALLDNIFFSFGTGSLQATIDDVYVCDDAGAAPHNTFLGDCQVDAVLPTGDGTLSEFDTTFPASPTTHYTKVDENPATADTDYNETPTLNDIDLFTYPNLPTITGGDTVLGVQVLALTKRAELAYSNIGLVARPTTVNYASASIPLQTTYRYKRNIWETNPDGGAWTTSAVNSSEFGVKKL